MTFRCFQQKNALKIKQSGKTGHLLSTAQRIMDTCVYQTKTSQIFWNSVTYIHVYWFKKVWKVDINTLLEICTKFTFIKIIDSFRTLLILSRSVFIFGQTLLQSKFIQLPQVFTWMPWIALLLLWNISSWVNHLHIIYVLTFSFQYQCFKKSEHLQLLRKAYTISFHSFCYFGHLGYSGDLLQSVFIRRC